MTSHCLWCDIEAAGALAVAAAQRAGRFTRRGRAVPAPIAAAVELANAALANAIKHAIKGAPPSTATIDLTAGAPTTLDEFKAVEEAIGQYLDNAVDEDERSAAQQASFFAAERVRDRLAAQWVKLAEDNAG